MYMQSATNPNLLACVGVFVQIHGDAKQVVNHLDSTKFEDSLRGLFPRYRKLSSGEDVCK